MNGIWTSTSTAMVALASTTACGAHDERRQTRTAATVAGTATVVASHAAGNLQLVRPNGAMADSGGA
jgi:hypothetical protein